MTASLTQSPRLAVLGKHPGAHELPPNLVDYDAERSAFSWARAREALAGLPGGGGLNIAFEAVDRHAAGSLADHVALRYLARDGRRTQHREREQFARVFLDFVWGEEAPPGG